MRTQNEGVMLSKRVRLARLNIEVMQLVKKNDNDKEIRTCSRQHEGKCPVLKFTCFDCNEMGHANGCKTRNTRSLSHQSILGGGLTQGQTCARSGHGQ